MGKKNKISRGIEWVRRFFEGMGKVEKAAFLAILFFGVLIRGMLFCIASVENGYYQHDVLGRYGHLDYIETIYETGQLPETNTVQYYHPPLHHLISAGVIKILSVFMSDITEMEEGLKVLALVYSILLIIVVWKITGEIGLSERARRVILLIYLVHPTMALMSISINNDLLSVLLIHYSLLWLIRWWKSPSVFRAGMLGLFTGLAMMTKMSGLILLPIDFIIFLIKFFATKQKRKEFLKMAVVFMVISLPIGLWYPVRNYNRFEQELTYVLDMKNHAEMVLRPVIFIEEKIKRDFLAQEQGWLSAAYLGEKDIFRIPVREDFINGIIGDGQIRVAGYNFYILTIRSAMLDDYIPIKQREWLPMICVMAMNFWLVLLYIVCMARGIWRIFRKRVEDFGWWMIIITLSVILIFGFVRTMMKLPYFFTANFRYITPMILVMVTMLGMIAKEGGRWRMISEIGFLLVLCSAMISDIMILI